MLNDLNQFEPDDSNLPAPVVKEQGQSNQTKSTVSSIDISTLFQKGVEEALLSVQPIMTVPIFNHPVPVAIDSSPDTGYLESIDKNLVLIHEHLKESKPETVNLEKIEGILQDIQHGQAQNNQAAERTSELQEKQDKREEQQKVVDDRLEKKEQKKKSQDDKDTKKYRKQMLDYEKTRSKREQKAEKSTLTSPTSGVSTEQLATYARNPYSIISDALSSLKTKFKNGFSKRPKFNKGGEFNIDFEDNPTESEEPQDTEQENPALPPPDEKESPDEEPVEDTETSEASEEAGDESPDEEENPTEQAVEDLGEETEVVEGTLEEISDNLESIADSLDIESLDNNKDLLALPPPDWLTRMNEGIDASVLGLEDDRAMESLTPLTDPLIQPEQSFNFDDKTAIISELTSSGVPAFLAPMLAGAVSTFGPAVMNSGLLDSIQPENTTNNFNTAGVMGPTAADSKVVVGEGEDEANFYKKSNEANVLLADTLEDPADSELVEALSANTESKEERAESSNLLGTILTAAIVAILAPHMDKIIGIVEQIIPIVGEVVDIVKDIWTKCLEPILVATSKSIISIINTLASFLTAIVTNATNLINVILPKITSIWGKVLEAIEPKIGDLVTKSMDFLTTIVDLLTKVAESFISMITNPKEYFRKVIDVLIDSVTTLVDAFVGDLVHGFRMILPETLGGFDKKYKQGQLELMEEDYQKRHHLDVKASEEMETSVIEAVEEGLAGTANIQAATVNVYAVNPESAANTSETSSNSTTTVNNDNSQAQVIVYAANSAIIERPGGGV